MSHLELELEIQRCVDGQLSEADQQALLRRIQALPDGWRHLALAYLENQLWSQTIQKTEPITPASPKPAAANATPLAATSSGHAPAGRRNSVGVWGKVVSSMAAGVMAGVILHGQMGTDGPGVSGTNGAASVAARDGFPFEPTGSSSSPASAGGTTARSVQVTTVDGSGLGGARVGITTPAPAHHAGANAAAQTTQPTLVSDELRKELQRSGYAIEEGQLYYSIPLPDGRHYIVPVNSVRVRNAIQ
ncbi:hypothetical protein [Planctomyces sp. SH-PL14]|uniref:hypothetical protein n=1 Tax=Planctomyces sp. SH-PL14 TaxID=1632864 RepID=UPI00078BEAC6|nr:hypothetical protein [Planctomyces sp. SH-PL14]AMV18192.1 hypothetical protein VT03_09910 [Planctomyces sp. SH-PL14]